MMPVAITTALPVTSDPFTSATQSSWRRRMVSTLLFVSTRNDARAVNSRRYATN